MNILTRDASANRSALNAPVSLDLLQIGPEIDWHPDHLVRSAWLEHVPFAFWIAKVLRPDRLVELGTERGVSYAAFCQAVERLGLPTRCYAVDTWQGDNHAGHYDESVYQEVAAFNDRKNRRFASLLRTTFAEAVNYFVDGEVDLLHIDGLHTYEAVSADFSTWQRKLSDRGVVVFHDTNVRRDDFGVWRFWAELSEQYPHFELLHGYGLGILGVGTDVPAPLRALFDANGQPEAKAAIREIFAARGASVQTRFDLANAQSDLSAVSAEAAAVRDENQRLQDQAARSLESHATATNEMVELQERLQQSSSRLLVLEERLAAASTEVSELRAMLARQRADFHGGVTRQISELRTVVSTAVEQRHAQSAEELDLRNRLAVAEARCAALLDSTSWRVTAPLRALSILMGTPRRATRSALKSGRLGDMRQTMLARARGENRRNQPAEVAAIERPARVLPPASQARLLSPRVLIVAEMSLPQCRKYRVEQKQAMIRSLGWDCTVVNWHDRERAMGLMQTHSVVIFYRVPAFPDVVEVLQEAERLGLPHYFELDDLIFDISDYAANPNLAGLDTATAESLFDGAVLYRKALELCGNVIASTPYLGERMQAVGGGTSFVIENALDTETLRIAEGVRPRDPDGRIRIIYGSGTRTHDADFAHAAQALKRVAEENPQVEIVLIGELNPPRPILALGDQVTRLPARPYAEYMEILAQSDIAIAPLMPASFNEAKSNIKFLEAATVGVPSVCSGRSAFTHAIRNGENGFLADTEGEWYQALTALVQDTELRRRIGAAARQDVLARYSPRAIAQRQLQPLLEQHRTVTDPRLHVLQVNILYRPQSFGGATVVAEEMARQLHNRTDTRVSVVASAPSGWMKPYAVERSEEDGVPIFRLGIQDRPGWMGETWDETAAESFHHIVRAVRPDVVHFHAMQGLGAACLRACQEEGIPYVVTLHDAWWVCERQFLVTGEGKYCGQHQIDLNICATCVPSLGATVLRNARLRHALQDASLLLTPSEHWRRFYVANGFAADRVVVNENGINLPAAPRPNQAPARLRFGFVAGTEAVKGFPLLKRTFEELSRDDWELVLVNHGLSIGIDSFADIKWRVRGTIRTVPPFKPADRDGFYEAIDVLLFPSQWPESFGLTVREALARNKWVIATDRGGAAEVIRPGVNGTLIPIGEDTAPFRKAVEDLLDRKANLHGWTNPSRDGLRDFATQATELHDILAFVVSTARADRTSGQLEAV